ncbi:hypothetical protein [Helicobacter sp. MIT 05-5294]|uniref:hypothetical protein n=1 Tax=Helicobacter sp. MIT 05-5294 TaxID=1548150 RepID=UPI0018835E52|nr:hypothetical protein [Helicobacter sp. MIT 05-5294]
MWVKLVSQIAHYEIDSSESLAMTADLFYCIIARLSQKAIYNVWIQRDSLVITQ